MASIGAGYDPEFLPTPVPVPLASAHVSDLVTVEGETEIRYTHFSLALSRSRKLTRWAAWNIDGASLFPGDAISRDGIAFRPDPRIDEGLQTLNDVYDHNELDRGHIARRADLLWGSMEEAATANVDSFFFTNITPQMNNFNQSGMAGLWGRLENEVLEKAPPARKVMSVMAGPVLADTDPEYRGCQVPLEFWKVVLYVRDGTLQARAFLLTQSLDRLAVPDFEEFKLYEHDLAFLEDRTGLGFDFAADAALAEVAGSMPRLVLSADQIRW
jgi:endonuclease G